jgi:hypothetical protein
MIHTVPHRSASGRLDHMWDFDPARRVVDVVLRLGTALPIDMCLPVCSIDRPRFASYALIRENEESWRILPSSFAHISPSVPDLYRVDRAIHMSLGRGDQLMLTNTPLGISFELEALALDSR